MTAYLGIDPGLDGALALIAGEYAEVYDMPTLEVGVGKSKKRRDYDVAEAHRILHMLASGYDSLTVVIEKVHAMPQNGSIASFSMGGGLMLWRALCVATALPHDLVSPETWKKALMGGKGGGKDAGRQRALELFPLMAGDLNLKKHHGRADALLLAEYRRRRLG